MHSLDSLFPSPVMTDVLKLLLGHPDEAFYQRLIATKIGRTLFQVQKALERVETAGLVTKTQSGKRIYYQADTAHPSFNGLQEALLAGHNIMFPDIDAIDEADQYSEDWIPGVTIAFFFGEIPEHGDEGANAFLFVIGDMAEDEFEEAIANLEEESYWQIRVICLTEQTFLQKYTRRHDFIKTLRVSDKEWLAGDEMMLESLLNQLPD